MLFKRKGDSPFHPHLSTDEVSLKKELKHCIEDCYENQKGATSTRPDTKGTVI